MTTTTDQETETGRPRRQWSESRRAAHEARQKGRKPDSKPDTELVAEAVLGEAVDNLKGLAGMFVIPIAPHLGFAITGVPKDGYEPGPDDWLEPNYANWQVVSRAEMAARGILPQAKRNARLLGVIHRFNVACRNVEILEAAGGVIAAAAVDARLVPPDVSMKLPGGVEYPILAPVIGDVLIYVAGQTPAPDVERQERQRRSASAAAGAHATNGTEPDSPDGMTPEQRAEAEATKERIRRRDEERARASVRAEGQTNVKGGVENT